MQLNHTTLSGNLTRDPELRTVGADRTVANFTLANNRRYKAGDGEPREETLFLDCEAWGRPAELVAQYLTKGSPLVVEGRLRLDQWTDKDGGKRSRVKLVVEQVHFVESRRSDDGADQDQAARRDHEQGPPVAAAGTANRRSNPATANRLRSSELPYNEDESQPPF